MWDIGIVIAYFTLIFIVAFRGRLKETKAAEAYFLSNRNLRWYSIAFSTVATNVQGYQFLGMMGSAYLYGLAQASLEINAIQGLLLAAFVFVPVFLKSKVTTISEYIKQRLGERLSLLYSLANIGLFSTITLGAALFWGAYAAELVFQEALLFIHPNRIIRILILIFFLGSFSAVYTYLGGLGAVVKTDIIQFVILFIGGVVVLYTAVETLGGWDQLQLKTPDRMHLHLPADHPVLPWTHMFGLFFLNINYWCANQTVIQRSLAARSLADAQTGLLVGGVLKYGMAVLIIVPGIALYGILGDTLGEPDQAFPYWVNSLAGGLKGLILCGLFASLMSTVDSTFNSIATLWAVDIYKPYINPKATDEQQIHAGRKAILWSFGSALLMGAVLTYLKFENPEAAFTHTLNSLRYYFNCGFVVLICVALWSLHPNKNWVMAAFLLTIPINVGLQFGMPELNYFVRAFIVIAVGLGIALVGSRSPLKKLELLFTSGGAWQTKAGWALAASLVALHIYWH